MRTKLRPSARATDLAREVFPTPGGPVRQRIGPFNFPLSEATAKYSTIRSLTFSSP